MGFQSHGLNLELENMFPPSRQLILIFESQAVMIVGNQHTPIHVQKFKLSLPLLATVENRSQTPSPWVDAAGEDRYNTGQSCNLATTRRTHRRSRSYRA